MASFTAGFFVNDFVDLRTGQVGSVAQGEEFELFWEAWARIEQNFIGTMPTPTEMTYGAIRGTLGILGDPYTLFVEPVAREQGL
jgi:carboxyl-terminal processing protease